MSELSRLHIIGTGLIGTSIGLAATTRGLQVTLQDASPTAAALAADLGAGDVVTTAAPDPQVVVVAAPPDVAARLVGAALHRFPEATVTDVASVKQAIETQVRRSGADMGRYVGSHPMAGRERSGAIAARSDLFQGRPWVVVEHDRADAARLTQVGQLATSTGAVVTTMSAQEHDIAVAAVSHLPQVAASLVAARLRDLPPESVSLAGQGLRDVTRIAASDPSLWTQILVGNAQAVAAVLGEVRDDIDVLVAALQRIGPDVGADAPGARRVLAETIAHGNAGHARIPGKHGAGPAAYDVVTVVVRDVPGTVARLLADVGAEDVNMEDLRIEHELGRQVGIVDIVVLPAVAEHLRGRLRERGWKVQE